MIDFHLLTALVEGSVSVLRDGNVKAPDMMNDFTYRLKNDLM